jgi:hypothetical protein
VGNLKENYRSSRLESPSVGRRARKHGALDPEPKLPPDQEARFQRDYARIVRQKARLGQRLNPDPDSPLHFYRHRAAWKAGELRIDASGHGLSRFKREGHPNMFVDGRNTRTGKRATPEEIRQNDAVRDLAVRRERRGR